MFNAKYEKRSNGIGIYLKFEYILNVILFITLKLLVTFKILITINTIFLFYFYFSPVSK